MSAGAIWGRGRNGVFDLLWLCTGGEVGEVGEEGETNI